jgi:predicted methyltransferase
MDKVMFAGSGRIRSGLTLIVLLFAALVMVACGAPAEEEAPEPAASEPETAEPVMLDRAILADPTRPEAEVAQDEGRKPLEVYEFLGVRPGMTVADVYNSDGYNTHLLSRAVGDSGQVYSVFEFYTDREAFGGQLYKVDIVTERVANAGLDNVELANRLADVPADSVDVAIAVRNYHDVEWVFADVTRAGQLAEFYRIVKPGGIVGIVEVASDDEGWNEETHRLGKETVIADFTGVGFELVEESDILANPGDDHSDSGFAEGRQTTDRYLLKFRKPAM